mmetsp:Transcript_72865/g.126493  ORF Transcript_72865/g.126493 Transcript_72865/m.126493 type:complete len:207 (+) Transcript_72865:283-903(+)
MFCQLVMALLDHLSHPWILLLFDDQLEKLHAILIKLHSFLCVARGFRSLRFVLKIDCPLQPTLLFLSLYPGFFLSLESCFLLCFQSFLLQSGLFLALLFFQPGLLFFQPGLFFAPFFFRLLLLGLVKCVSLLCFDPFLLKRLFDCLLLLCLSLCLRLLRLSPCLLSLELRLFLLGFLNCFQISLELCLFLSLKSSIISVFCSFARS